MTGQRQWPGEGFEKERNSSYHDIIKNSRCTGTPPHSDMTHMYMSISSLKIISDIFGSSLTILLVKIVIFRFSIIIIYEGKMSSNREGSVINEYLTEPVFWRRAGDRWMHWDQRIRLKSPPVVPHGRIIHLVKFDHYADELEEWLMRKKKAL